MKGEMSERDDDQGYKGKWIPSGSTHLPTHASSIH
jgi:hypothetical protein